MSKRQPKTKRLQKKQTKKKMQSQVQTIQPDLNVEKLSQSELESIITQDEQRKQQGQKRRQNLLFNRSKKVQAIAEMGVDPTTIPVRQIDSIKLKDLDNLSRDKYPFLFPSFGFDFNKVYKLKNDERLYLAFRDFAGETSVEEIMEQFENMSSEELLDRLEVLAQMQPTYSKSTKSGSSGAAGEYRMTWAKQNVITEYQAETYNKNRRKAKKQRKHQGNYKGFQVLKDGHRNSFSEVTPHGMLVIMNAFMSHVTEGDRVTFYNEMYPRIKKHMPDFWELLPKPLN